MIYERSLDIDQWDYPFGSSDVDLKCSNCGCPDRSDVQALTEL